MPGTKTCKIESIHERRLKPFGSVVIKKKTLKARKACDTWGFQAKPQKAHAGLAQVQQGRSRVNGHF